MDTSRKTLDAEQWRILKQAFEQLVELSPNDRQEKVHECGLSAELLEQLWVLLQHADADQTGAFTLGLRQAASPLNGMSLNAAESDLRGAQLGAWELCEKIGVGGMGEVYKARRVDGRYQGWAAVKLLRTGREGEDILRRFASEQQALARLNHPHIARLLDAGQSPVGSPYFVMELVEGQSLDLACAQLGLRQRLEVFLQLLQAVAHAHARLLIHRDLKPSNVMVDQQNQVKLLDFGIAKALDPMQSEDLQATLLEQRVLTPAYSSPEQIRGEAVTTATDIYSLGVLLYGLLTGQKPYGLKATTPAEAAQAVLEEQPHAPSLVTCAQTASRAWAIDASLLKGDLDNIVLKALRKEAEERYLSVDAFAADIRAFLDGFPVSARPLSLPYVMSKWIARHRLVSLFSTIAIALILLASGAALVEARRAQQANMQAQENLERLKSITRGVLYRVGNQIENLPGGIDIRAKMTKELIDDLEKLANSADADPAIQEDLAHAWVRMAEMQADNQNRSLLQNDAAIESAKRAIYWFERCAPTQNTAPSFAVAWGEAWRAVANVARSNGNLKDALAAQEQRLTILEKANQRFPQNEHVLHGLASTHLNRGQLLSAESKTAAQAAREIQAAQQDFTALVAITPKDSASYHQLGVSYGAEAYQAINLGEFERSAKASANAVKALQLARQIKPQNVAHLSALANEANLACNSALNLQRVDGYEMCELSWSSYGELIQMEPTNAAWKLRRAFGAVFTAPALAERGQGKEAQQRLQMAIVELSPLAKSDKEKRRLAWLHLELASVAAASIAQAELVRIKPDFADTLPSERDQAAWLLRARWFELSAKFAVSITARDYKRQASLAYQTAHQIQPLPNLMLARWQQVKP